MLDSKMTEEKEQLWEPVEPEKVIRALLRWIYADAIEEGAEKDVELLESLFKAAHKYDLESLAVWLATAWPKYSSPCWRRLSC